MATDKKATGKKTTEKKATGPEVIHAKHVTLNFAVAPVDREQAARHIADRVLAMASGIRVGIDPETGKPRVYNKAEKPPPVKRKAEEKAGLEKEIGDVEKILLRAPVYESVEDYMGDISDELDWALQKYLHDVMPLQAAAFLRDELTGQKRRKE